MNKTQQQIDFENAMSSTNYKVIIGDSGAGVGKTSTVLGGLDKATTPNDSVLMLSFGADIAASNAKRMPSYCMSKTIHSFSLNLVLNVKSPNGGNHNFDPEPYTIKFLKKYSEFDDLNHTEKILLLVALSKYFKSDRFDFGHFTEFVKVSKALETFVSMMLNFKIRLNHDSQVKMLQIYLKTDVLRYNVDFLIVDEVQDVSFVALDIVNMINAKKKIFIGDREQNIMQFATGNIEESSFERIYKIYGSKNTTKILPLTITFRCSQSIANHIQYWMKNYVREDFKFESGRKQEITLGNRIDKNIAILTRAKKEIVSIAIDAFNLNIPLRSQKKVGQLFSIPILISFGVKNEYESRLQNKGRPSNKWWNQNEYLYELYLEYIEYKEINSEYESSFGTYLINDSLTASNEVVMDAKLASVGWKTLNEARQHLIKHENNKHAILIGTAHGTKGLEYDIVYLTDAISNFIEEENEKNIEAEYELTDKDKPEKYLGYVAATRAKDKVFNAKFLDPNINNDTDEYLLQDIENAELGTDVVYDYNVTTFLMQYGVIY